MSSTPTSEAAAVETQMPSPSPVTKTDVDLKSSNYETDECISEEERRFYQKIFPTIDVVNTRKVHCTVCRLHIGTAPSAENNIKMHPILRVTHCVKCHDFYNSGEFSKGEDGSELYCRWCGQGGEVYCCSTCPFVFCKSCIIKNLSRGVIGDIEQNENWNCFNCTSKILWPLRAQHWALVNYIAAQKKGIQLMELPESEQRQLMQKDNSTCCRLAKSKASSMSDSMESLESNISKRSHASSVNSSKKTPKAQGPQAKRIKLSNDEVVCTPDLLSMLEPDCQISVPQKPTLRAIAPSPNTTTVPRIVTVQQNYSGPSSGFNGGASSAVPRNSAPPPLVPSSSAIRFRQSMNNTPTLVRRTLVPGAVRNIGPVFHTINGFRVDLNSAAQQESYRLPNGRLIQVKRQVPAGQSPPQPSTPLAPPTPISAGSQVIIRHRPPLQPAAGPRQGAYGTNMGIYTPPPPVQQQRMPHLVRLNNGTQMQAVPVQMQPQVQQQAQVQGTNTNGTPVVLAHPVPNVRAPTLVRHTFPNNPVGTARTQLQEQIFNAMEICTHLTGKVQTLTNSNAYNSARSYLDLKELYIHLSYLMTYAIGRFKGLQDKCLADMRELGFKNDANSLENGQLAAEKQASDDEDNEIEIVEPKTDTITIDSDNEDEIPSTSTESTLKITSVTSTASDPNFTVPAAPEGGLMDIDVSQFTSSILASMLEVDISEGSGEINRKPLVSPGGTVQKKQPRKKTTNKRNPALLQLERERMEETKRSDAKLKMKVVVKLKRVEEDYPIARKWFEEQKLLALTKNKSLPNVTDEESIAEKPVEQVAPMTDGGPSCKINSGKEEPSGEVETNATDTTVETSSKQADERVYKHHDSNEQAADKEKSTEVLENIKTPENDQIPKIASIDQSEDVEMNKENTADIIGEIEVNKSDEHPSYETSNEPVDAVDGAEKLNMPDKLNITASVDAAKPESERTSEANVLADPAMPSINNISEIAAKTEQAVNTAQLQETLEIKAELQSSTCSNQLSLREKEDCVNASTAQQPDITCDLEPKTNLKDSAAVQQFD